MTKPTIRPWWPAKIRLYIHPVWQGFSLDSLEAVGGICDQQSLIIGFVVHWFIFISSPEQRSRRAIVLPSASALASTNVIVFFKVFKTSLFPNLITDLIHVWYDYTYWSKILHSTIATNLGHVKVKVTDIFFWTTFPSKAELRTTFIYFI